MKKNDKLAYSIGFVSLFYWLCVWAIPTYRLVSPEGLPLSGLGLIVSTFNDTSFSYLVMIVSVVYLISIKFSRGKYRLATTSLLFGVWFMSTIAYFFWTITQGLLVPNLMLHAGYCYAIWLDLRGN